MFCRTFAVLAAASIVCGCGRLKSVDPVDKAMAVYKVGNQTEALRIIRTAAEKGHPRAQNLLGFIYDKGNIPRADDGEFIYEKGWGMTQDYAEAARWYRRAAEAGFIKAQNNMGWMYYEGRGVPKDYREAAKWFYNAALRGDADGQSNLGLMYQFGLGVEKDRVEACRWYLLAEAQGNQTASGNMSTIRITPEGMAEAQKRASQTQQEIAKAQKRDSKGQ